HGQAQGRCSVPAVVLRLRLTHGAAEVVRLLSKLTLNPKAEFALDPPSRCVYIADLDPGSRITFFNLYMFWWGEHETCCMDYMAPIGARHDFLIGAGSRNNQRTHHRPERCDHRASQSISNKYWYRRDTGIGFQRERLV